MILDNKEVKKMLKYAPSTFQKESRKWLYREGRSFIGDRKKDGLIRKSLKKRKTVSGKEWKENFINTIRFRIHKGRGLNNKLEAGLLYTNKKKVHEIIEKLAEGGFINSEKYMIVPHYDIMKKYNKPIALFHKKARRNEFSFFFKRNRIYYTDNKTGQLMFVGMKRIRIKKVRQLDIDKKWNSRLPKMLLRGYKMLDRTCKKVEKKRLSK